MIERRQDSPQLLQRYGSSGEWQGFLALRLVSVASLVAVWILASLLLSPRVLPGPLETMGFMWQEYQSGRLLFHVFNTVERVLLSFLASMVIGVLSGVAMGASQYTNRLLEGWLVAGLALPRLVPIVVAYLLFGLNDWSAVFAVTVSVAPAVCAQLREGTRALDTRLIDMAKVFRRSAFETWRKVVLPQLLPYVLGTGRAAMSLAWKMVVVAELMGRTNGVGYQLAFYFQMFDMRGILAYAMAMVLVLASIDLGLFRFLDRVAFRWRKPVRLAG